MCMFMTVCGTRSMCMFGNTALDIDIYMCECVFMCMWNARSVQQCLFGNIA